MLDAVSREDDGPPARPAIMHAIRLGEPASPPARRVRPIVAGGLAAPSGQRRESTGGWLQDLTCSSLEAPGWTRARRGNQRQSSMT